MENINKKLDEILQILKETKKKPKKKTAPKQEKTEQPEENIDFTILF